MDWALYRRKEGTFERSSGILACCKAKDHDEAVAILLPDSGLREDQILVEPICAPGESCVARFFSDSGPELSEEDLKSSCYNHEWDI